MRITGWALTAVAFAAASPAFAQQTAIEQLQTRLEALEREAAALRGQVQELQRQQTATPVSAVPVQPAAVVSVRDRHDDPRPAAAEPWDQSYVGIHAGLARFRTIIFPGVGGPERDATSGYSFGAQVGRRWQSGNVVTGIELEATFPQVPDHDSSAGLSFPGPVTQLDQRWSGQARANIGFASGPLLGFAIAGLDVTQLRLEIASLVCTTAATCSLVGAPTIWRRTYVGSVLGLGAAIQLGDGYSLGLEATRSNLGRTTNGAFEYDVRSDAVLLRLNRALP